MKKTLLWLVVAICLSAALPAQKLALTLSGGMGYFIGGDLSTGLKGENAYRLDALNVSPGFAVQKTGLNFAGEITFYPGKHFGIGVGLEYQRYAKESQIGFTMGSVDATETIKPQTTAMPVTLNLHYRITLSSRLKLVLTAGAGYYLTTLKYDYATEFGIGAKRGAETYSFQARKAAIGGQGGLGLEFAFSRRLAIVLNAVGRYASVGPFENGTWSNSRSGSFGEFSDNGSDDAFWIYDWLQAGKTYSRLAFQETAPSGMQDISNARKAKIDLSGGGVTLGVKFGIGRI
jgi:hypothetical protein